MVIGRHSFWSDATRDAIDTLYHVGFVLFCFFGFFLLLLEKGTKIIIMLCMYVEKLS